MRPAVGLGLIILAGCATAEVPARGEGGKCDASRAAKLEGRVRSEALGDKAKRLTGAEALRWIPPGAMVTMDYRENRVNLRLDPRNRVVRITCG